MAAAVLAWCAAAALAQPVRIRPAAAPYEVPELAIAGGADASMRPHLERYASDLRSLQQFYSARFSPAGENALERFYRSWRAALDRVDFDRLGTDGRIDYLLFRNMIEREITGGERERKLREEMSALLPFSQSIVDLADARQRVDPLDPAKAAATLANLNKQLDELVRWVGSGKPEDKKVKPTVAARAARSVGVLRDALKRWYEFYDGYDPLFRWWVSDPYKQADAALGKYAEATREKLAGVKKDDRDTILGDPIGREALLSELRHELVPYTPEELIEIANREFAWCDTEMLKASREMGFGDDWRRALEHVKTLHVPPGEQPSLIRNMVLEAIEFVDKHELVTVPQLARDTWRMEMMTPERQRINPFFLGGPMIIVSYPTDGMTHEQKMMSMRGNNIHFSRSTVFHEVIPGHFLQTFMNERNMPYRRPFRTPFWVEGWSLYWEMQFWDLGFPQTPENRIGMLFWRMHRCARIIFSLSFHLEKMSAQQCVDFLVNRVGHERENAAAEVRRSFETSYDPLYQSAYLLGGLQFRALHKELVGGGRMKNREFHDAILKMNSIPVEMVRAALTGQRLTKEFTPSWKFYGELRAADIGNGNGGRASQAAGTRQTGSPSHLN
jgi:uncharacterized protein (DUF885 family)